MGRRSMISLDHSKQVSPSSSELRIPLIYFICGPLPLLCFCLQPWPLNSSLLPIARASTDNRTTHFPSRSSTLHYLQNSNHLPSCFLYYYRAATARSLPAKWNRCLLLVYQVSTCLHRTPVCSAVLPSAHPVRFVVGSLSSSLFPVALGSWYLFRKVTNPACPTSTLLSYIFPSFLT